MSPSPHVTKRVAAHPVITTLSRATAWQASLFPFGDAEHFNRLQVPGALVQMQLGVYLLVTQASRRAPWPPVTRRSLGMAAASLVDGSADLRDQCDGLRGDRHANEH